MPLPSWLPPSNCTSPADNATKVTGAGAANVTDMAATSTYSNHTNDSSIDNGTGAPISQPLASISEELTSSTSSSACVDLEAPSVSTIVRFAFGCVGIWLCGPILSLIDTRSARALLVVRKSLIIMYEYYNHLKDQLLSSWDFLSFVLNHE